MSDPGINGPMSEFERRAALLFAHCATVQELLEVADADEAMAAILIAWDFEDEGAEQPTAPVLFVSPHYEAMRISPEKNVDGPVYVTLIVTPPAEFRDTKANGRRWFANLFGEVCNEVCDLEGKPIAGSSGTHLRIVKHDTNTDGLMVTGWPCWADATDPLTLKDADGLPTLIAGLEMHLEA